MLNFILFFIMFINMHILCIYYRVFVYRAIIVCLFCSAGGPPAARRSRAGFHRGRGRFPVRREGPMKFERDFDFESANAQFNKDEIDKEFQSKLKLKGTSGLPNMQDQLKNYVSVLLKRVLEYTVTLYFKVSLLHVLTIIITRQYA